MGEAVELAVRGTVGSQAAARVRECLRAAAVQAPAPLAEVRARLSALPSGLVAQVNAEVAGRRVRVQVAAAQARAVADRLAVRFAERVAQAAQGWIPRSWPHPGTAQPPLGPAPRVARVKTPRLVWCAPEVAVMTMDAMDYDVHVFTDPETEADAAVFRSGPTGYRLARTVPAPLPRRGRVPLTLAARPTPRLTASRAVARLVAAELPFLFFADPIRETGRLLYRRFDGTLGLIASTP
jgi:hypothetical protein